MTRPGVVQEWFEEGALWPDRVGGPGGGGIGVFVAQLAALTLRDHRVDPEGAAIFPVIWVGRRCLPYGRALPAAVAASSLWVGAESAEDRLWVLETVIRGVGMVEGVEPVAEAGGKLAPPRVPLAAVFADGSGLDRVATRRLQLACRGRGVWLVLTRPSAERSVLSTAGLRWSIRCVPGRSGRPCWRVTLLRSKLGAAGPPSVEAGGGLRLVSPPMGPGSAATAAAMMKAGPGGDRGVLWVEDGEPSAGMPDTMPPPVPGCLEEAG